MHTTVIADLYTSHGIIGKYHRYEVCCLQIQQTKSQEVIKKRKEKYKVKLKMVIINPFGVNVFQNNEIT